MNASKFKILRYMQKLNAKTNYQIYTADDELRVRQWSDHDANCAYFRLVYAAHYGKDQWAHLDSSIFCPLHDCETCPYSGADTLCQTAQDELPYTITNATLFNIIEEIENDE